MKKEKPELTEAIAKVNVEAVVIKPDVYARLNEKQKVEFYDNGNELNEVCKNCYWFCKGDEGRFCMTNNNYYLHSLFIKWNSEKCGCTCFERGKHFFYG